MINNEGIYIGVGLILEKTNTNIGSKKLISILSRESLYGFRKVLFTNVLAQITLKSNNDYENIKKQK